MRPIVSSALAALIAFSFAAGASAHAKLIKSDPWANGEAKDRKKVELTFSEPISGKLSGASVKDARGKAIASTSMVDQKGKGLVISFKDGLRAGVYQLNWHAVASDDGHRTTGAFPFVVK
jgi:methionine-rich copper-binding protein CopC